MTNCATYTGDLIIGLNEDGDWDLNYINGQPCMTDGFDTAVMLAVFGEPDFWQNSLTNDPNEKYISEFPEVVRLGKVTDDTLKKGKAAIERSLLFLKNTGIAQNVVVSGGVLSVFGLYWRIEISRGNIVSRYQINWDKGVIEVAGLPLIEFGKIKPKRYHEPMLNPDGSKMLNPDGSVQLYEYVE